MSKAVEAPSWTWIAAGPLAVWSLVVLLPLLFASASRMLDLLLPPVLLGAGCAAGALVLLDGTLRRIGIGRGARWLLLTSYQGSALVALNALHGTSDSIMNLMIVLGLVCLERLRHVDFTTDRHGICLGVIAGLTFLTRHEAVVIGPLLLLALTALLSTERRVGRIQGQVAMFAMGFVYGIVLRAAWRWILRGTSLEMSGWIMIPGGGGPVGHVAEWALWSEIRQFLTTSLATPVIIVALLFRFGRRRDGFALSLGLLIAALPVLQAILHASGRVSGWQGPMLYQIPVAVVAVAHLMSAGEHARGGFRSHGAGWIWMTALALSTVVGWIGLRVQSVIGSTGGP